MEANRYFIKQLDVAHLRAPLLKANATSVASELKFVYLPSQKGEKV